MSTSEPRSTPPLQTIKSLPPAVKRRRRGPQKPQDMRTMRGFLARGVGNGLHVSHIFWRAFPDLPRRFVWYNKDRVELSHYIDRLYAKDTKFALAAESSGKVLDIEYPSSSDMSATEWYSANAAALFACLGLRSIFDVPLWGRVRFITDGSYLVPAEYIGALITARPDEFGHLNHEADWHVATNKDLIKMGLKPEDVTTGMYRDQAKPTEVDDTSGEAGDEPSLPPVETTVRRLDKGTYIDWTTRVSDGERSWYVRRLYRDAHVFYEATAWQPTGPWRVWTRDSSVMLALDITA